MSTPVPTQTQLDQVAWVCADCGERYGRRVPESGSTWHLDTCGVCGERDYCTEPHDFGGLRQVTP